VLKCECGESTYQGYPCRHEMSVCVLVLKDPKVLHFEKRWRKDFFVPKTEEKKEGEEGGEGGEEGEDGEDGKEGEEEEEDVIQKKKVLILWVV